MLDAAVGWPPRLYALVGHPVGCFARLIGACERSWNRPAWPDAARRLLGVVTILLVMLAGGGAAWAIGEGIAAIMGRWAWIGLALLAAPGLAQRSLDDHVRPIADALERGDLPAARAAVGMIVGRDTASLDE
ncbi:MAG: cobalamin biosynthesis protein, partial [Sphingomonas sp.]